MSAMGKALGAATGTILHLFVADRGLAMSVLAWVALAGASVRIAPAARRWGSPVFAAGLMIMLIHSVWHTARDRAITGG
jgi:predicted membrane channel-forming protein YqfA (hemolysin III family)